MTVSHTIAFSVTRIQQHIEDPIPQTRGLLEGHILIDGEPL